MPNHTPLSRYLLAGMALLMLFAALPSAKTIVRSWADAHRTQRRALSFERVHFVDELPPQNPLPPRFR